MEPTSKKIGFDITQKERGRIFSNYQTVKSIIESETFECEEFTEFPITEKMLQSYKIMVFACPDSSKFKEREIEAILNYISVGGHVILLNHAGGDQGRRTNLGSITAQLGISFKNDEVLDSNSNLGVEAYPLITKFARHPILQDINSICYRIGCSLETSHKAIPLAFTGTFADPPEKAVLALAQYGKGYIFVSGSYEMFQDDVKGGISYPNNAKLIKNIILWLNTPDSSKLTKPPKESKVISQDLTRFLSSSSQPSPPQISPLPNDIQEIMAQVKNFAKDLQKLKEEHQTILSENIEVKEKLKIFELNLADFPDQVLSELPLEVEENHSKIKIHSKLISNLEKKILLLQDKISQIEHKLEIISDQIKSISSGTRDLSLTPPLITTASEIFKQKASFPHSKFTAKINACEQMLQILETKFKNGLLSPAEYVQKRRKFEKKIAELEQYC